MSRSPPAPGLVVQPVHVLRDEQEAVAKRLFELDELRTFDRDFYDKLVDDVWWDQSLNGAAEDFISALEERNLIDEPLFDRLVDLRPAVRERIEEVRAACRSTMR